MGTHNNDLLRNEMKLIARKPVVWVSDQVIPRPACSATDTSWHIELSLASKFRYDTSFQ